MSVTTDPIAGLVILGGCIGFLVWWALEPADDTNDENDGNDEDDGDAREHEFMVVDMPAALLHARDRAARARQRRRRCEEAQRTASSTPEPRCHTPPPLPRDQ